MPITITRHARCAIHLSRAQERAAAQLCREGAIYAGGGFSIATARVLVAVGVAQWGKRPTGAYQRTPTGQRGPWVVDWSIVPACTGSNERGQEGSLYP